MSATLGAALKKIAVALLADRKNWEKLAVALFAALLLFLLPILSVEAIFQADMDWDSPELVSAVLEELDVGSLGFLENSNNILTYNKTISKGVVLLILLSLKIGYTAGVATCGIIRSSTVDLYLYSYSKTVLR